MKILSQEQQARSGSSSFRSSVDTGYEVVGTSDPRERG